MRASIDAIWHGVAELDGDLVGVANLGRSDERLGDVEALRPPRRPGPRRRHPPGRGHARAGARRRAAVARALRRQRPRPRVLRRPRLRRDPPRHPRRPARPGLDAEGAPDGQPPHLAPSRSQRYGRYDGGDPLAAAGRPRRGARRHRRGRDGRLLARARDAGVPAPRRQGPARPRRPGPPGRGEAPRAAPEAQPRRHARRRSASCSTRRVLEERKQLARDVEMDDGDRAFREMQLENLPPNTAAAVSELSSYDWQSREAREDYEEIKDLLGREMLDQRFAGMKQALENATDEDRAGHQRDARRPQRAAREAAARRGHPGGLRRVHGQARRVLPGGPAEPRRAPRRHGPAGRGRPADAELDVGRAARRADAALAAGLRLARS